MEVCGSDHLPRVLLMFYLVNTADLTHAVWPLLAEPLGGCEVSNTFISVAHLSVALTGIHRPTYKELCHSTILILYVH